MILGKPNRLGHISVSMNRSQTQTPGLTERLASRVALLLLAVTLVLSQWPVGAGEPAMARPLATSLIAPRPIVKPCLPGQTSLRIAQSEARFVTPDHDRRQLLPARSFAADTNAQSAFTLVRYALWAARSRPTAFRHFDACGPPPLTP